MEPSSGRCLLLKYKTLQIRGPRSIEQDVSMTYMQGENMAPVGSNLQAKPADSRMTAM